jgi:phosphohistidine phosphatase
MGRWLRTTGHLPDQVLCSSALRTRQTWQLAQAQLGMTPPVAFEDEIYQASPEELLTLIRLTSPTVNTLLVIGHDPAIPELARTLPTSGEGGAATNARVMGKFPTAAIAILEFTGNWDQLATGSTRLTCFVTPRDLQVTSEAE